MEKIRILISATGYFPAKRYGGPPISIRNFCNLVGDKCDCSIITRDHEYQEKMRLEGIEEGWQHYGSCQVLYLRSENLGLLRYLKIIDEIKPQLIYINSLFDARFTIPLLICGRIRKIPCLIAPRGELAHQAVSRKAYKKKPYLKIFRLLFLNNRVWFQASSHIETMDISKRIEGSESRIVLLPNIPSVPNTIEPKTAKSIGELSIIFLGRIMDIKNLSYAIDVISQLHGRVRFNIYGPIEDEEYWKDCLNKIKGLPEEISVVYHGEIKHKDVFNAYKQNDILFLPSKIESYGQAIAESFYAGVPVVISNRTPWKEVQKYNCGYSGSLNDKEAFIRIVQKYIDMSDTEFQECSRSAIAYIKEKSNISTIKDTYIDFLNNVVNANA